MIEVYYIEGRGTGLRLNESPTYDESLIINGNRNYITIATGNTASDENWWNVCLNKEEAKAVFRHMAKLIRDMD